MNLPATPPWAPGSKTDFTARNGLTTEPIPLDPYRTQEFFDLERDKVFKRAWLLMAREEELPNPGDYVVKQIDPCKVSALIARGKDGRLRAFHNSCSHRGSGLSQPRRATALVLSAPITPGPTAPTARCRTFRMSRASSMSTRPNVASRASRSTPGMAGSF